MKAAWLLASALGLGIAAAPARAQHEGMTMPMPAPPKAAPPTVKPESPPAAPHPPEHSGMADMQHPAPDGPAVTAAPPMESHQRMGHEMAGALGPYPMSREASGTAWQPDSSLHAGVETMRGGWMLMGHALLNLVYDRQDGPRGGDKTFAAGMAMGIAQRPFANGDVLQLKAMVSPDPFMGRSGYPLLLASGETADGATRLVDRQHPHDLFMELSASYGLRLGGTAGAFLYAGLPGEPAFGPPAFMHRMSAMDSPEAPISHHWLDSTHIAFGVVTAGLVFDRLKVEASRFNGREPDQRRYDIETGPLDSTALRASWNPLPEVSLQASWAHLVGPEQLEPGENQTRWSLSGIYARRIGADGWWSTTAAWGRRRTEGRDNLDAFALESAVALGPWTAFGRAERTENDELVPAAGHGPAFTVGKISAGAIRDFKVAPHVKLGVGALYALNFVPRGLQPLYRGDPGGGMAFLRVRID